MSLIKKYMGALFIAGLAVVGLAGPASATQASCPEDHVCFFTEPNYGGKQSNWKSPRFPHCDKVLNAPARSIINNTDRAWAFFIREDCKGDAHWIPGRTWDTYVSSTYTWRG